MANICHAQLDYSIAWGGSLPLFHLITVISSSCAKHMGSIMHLAIQPGQLPDAMRMLHGERNA
jgi:hypothetical protein